MYKKIIKNKEDLHLPMTLTYLQFHALSHEDKKKYVLDDRHHFQHDHPVGWAEHQPKSIAEARDHSDLFKVGTADEWKEYLDSKTPKQ